VTSLAVSEAAAEPAPAFTTELRVRFADVDAAGILFYPRYFELMNDVVEDWFAHLGFGFDQMILEKGLALPTRKVEADYLRPSRLGDRLTAEVAVKSVGRTSLQVQISYRAGEELRWRCQAVLVLAETATGRPVPWPDELRRKLG